MMWWHRLLQIKKVYVTYSGSDLDDAAGNQVTQFTVGDAAVQARRMPPPM